MFIKVVKDSKTIPQEIAGISLPSFYLQQNNWDDYHYSTTYLLYLSSKHSENGEVEFIGRLKIMKLGQLEYEYNLLSVGDYDELPSGFYSISGSLDFYERVSEFDRVLRDTLLKALNDLVAYPEYREITASENVYKKSLMRGINENNDLFELAPILLSRNFTKLMDLDFKFEFKMPELDSSIAFTFNSPKYGTFREISLPNRICVLIGRNGCGKSTLLSRLSRIAFSSPSERDDEILQQIGTIKPYGIGFTRIIMMSYSAFDSFQTPGVFIRDKELIVDEMKKRRGRFIFCGIRDIIGELEEILPKLQANSKGKLRDEDILNDRTTNTQLKSIASLGSEFIANIKSILEDNQVSIYLNALEIVSNEASMFDFIELFKKIDDIDSLLKKFMNLSTGHKFILHAISSLIALSQNRSLILFDEPETHLHPPILAVFMKAIRYILTEKKSFMVLATHSPVILQETLKDHVFLIRRMESLMTIRQPKIQTFGENISLLTSEVFNLSSDLTEFQNTFDQIIDIMTDFPENYNHEKLLDFLEELFDPGLSFQARAYVLSKLYNTNSDVDS